MEEDDPVLREVKNVREGKKEISEKARQRENSLHEEVSDLWLLVTNCLYQWYRP